MAMMTGNPDLCSEIENHKEAKIPLEMAGFPTECPISQVRRIESKFFHNLILCNSFPYLGP